LEGIVFESEEADLIFDISSSKEASIVAFIAPKISPGEVNLTSLLAGCTFDVNLTVGRVKNTVTIGYSPVTSLGLNPERTACMTNLSFTGLEFMKKCIFLEFEAVVARSR